MAYAVSLVSQFMHDPRESHMQVHSEIPKICTRKRSPYFIHGHFRVEAFANADWQDLLKTEDQPLAIA